MPVAFGVYGWVKPGPILHFSLPAPDSAPGCCGPAAAGREETEGGEDGAAGLYLDINRPRGGAAAERQEMLMFVAPESPGIPDPGLQPETVQFQEPSGNGRDLIAFLAVLSFVVVVLIAFYIARGPAAAGMYGVPTVVVVCFGAWLALRRREAPRRWRSSSITYRSKNDRLKYARSWGTEGAEAPTLPNSESEGSAAAEPNHRSVAPRGPEQLN